MKLLLVSLTATKAHTCLQIPHRIHSVGSILWTPSLQTFALQYFSLTCSSYSLRKYLIVVRTGFGAVLPSPQREPSITRFPSLSSFSISPSSPSPDVIFSSIWSIWYVPILQVGHFPQDSDWVKERKNFATSTMQLSSSITTIPPEPMIEPTFVGESKSTGRSRCSSGIHPPEGPPVWTALNFFPPIIP